MGRANRHPPSRLAEKLHAIRTRLELSQWQLIERLDCPQIPLYAASISQYEQGKREPPLPVLLRYARLAGVQVETLIDDELDLPKRLPGRLKGGLGK
ncbi:MAG: helix-turn-helix domain-containing protein [Acidobacteriota bacterium]|nr:helix-turn-helix domain-containing protein [Acidobacteriota bacterium]